MKVEVYVQARMGSTRLPGKVMKKVLNKPLLQFQIERLRYSKEIDGLVILTTTLPQDDQIVQFCRELGVDCLRGSSEDVLDRYYQAAQLRQSDAIVRVTSDCPLIDPDILDEVVRVFKSQPLDYVSNTLIRTYPRGLDVEVLSFQSLCRAWREGIREEEREHVTPYLYRHPELFRLQNVALTKVAALTPPAEQHRWTVDTEADFELIKRILEALYPSSPQFRMEDVFNLLKKHPSWSQLNAHIEQKTVPHSTL